MLRLSLKLFFLIISGKILVHICKCYVILYICITNSYDNSFLDEYNAVNTV